MAKADIRFAHRRYSSGSDKWWDGDAKNPPEAVDWAHAAARGVIADLEGRGGIKHSLQGIDEVVRVEIVTSLAAIIRTAGEDRPWRLPL